MLISWTLVYRFFFFYLWTAAQLDCVYVCVSHFPAPGRHRDIYVGVCLFKTAGVTNTHARAHTHLTHARAAVIDDSNLCLTFRREEVEGDGGCWRRRFGAEDGYRCYWALDPQRSGLLWILRPMRPTYRAADLLDRSLCVRRPSGTQVNNRDWGCAFFREKKEEKTHRWRWGNGSNLVSSEI